jgi:hypothetical protein
LQGSSGSTGSNNSALGHLALYQVTSGTLNVGLGYLAGTAITTGNSNTAIGSQSLYSLTTGTNNTAIGYLAGNTITTGSNNTALGYNAYLTGSYTQSTAIGYSAQPTASNQVVLGTAAESVVCPNKVGIGTYSPSYPLHITTGVAATTVSRSGYYGGNGSLFVSSNGIPTASIATSYDIISAAGIFSVNSITASDNRIKTNIKSIDINDARSILYQLKPSVYNYVDQVKHGSLPIYGFIAQDVHSIIKSCIRFRKEFIPNIYEIGAITDKNIITLNSKTTNIFGADENGLDNSGNPIKLKLFDTSNNELITTITKIIDEKIFQISSSLSTSDIFIFGQEIDDFYNLEKDQIFTITTAAVQEIDKIVQTQQETIASLQARLAAIEARLSSANIA